MSVIDTIDDDKNGRRTFEDSARTGLHSALDAFHHLTESLLLAQMLGNHYPGFNSISTLTRNRTNLTGSFWPNQVVSINLIMLFMNLISKSC